jgi:hypothetical protein
VKGRPVAAAQILAEARPLRAALAIVLAFGSGWLSIDPCRGDELDAIRGEVARLLGGRSGAARWTLIVFGSIGAVLALPLAAIWDLGAWLLRRTDR